jgi:hypothetical protein
MRAVLACENGGVHTVRYGQCRVTGVLRLASNAHRGVAGCLTCCEWLEVNTGSLPISASHTASSGVKARRTVC